MNARPDHSQGVDSRYRVYQIDADGKVASFSEVAAASDQEAGAKAQELVDGHAVELWDRSRLIARFALKEKR